MFKAPTNNNHHHSPNNNNIVSAFGIDPMSLQKKLSGFHRTAAEQMLNGLQSAHAAAAAAAAAAASSSSRHPQQQPLPLVHSTTHASGVGRSSHEDPDLSDLDDMDDEDMDDENIDIVDDIEPVEAGRTQLRPSANPDVMVSLPFRNIKKHNVTNEFDYKLCAQP